MPNKTISIKREGREEKRVTVSDRDAAPMTSNIIHHSNAADDVKRLARKEIAVTGWTHIDKTELQIEDEE